MNKSKSLPGRLRKGVLLQRLSPRKKGYRRYLKIALAPFFLFVCNSALAAEYEIDPAHSFVIFRIQHLGFSWLHGQFRNIQGRFTYDSSNPEASEITATIDASSVDTNHAERDKHLRSADFLDVSTYEEIKFESTRYIGSATGGTLEGVLSLHGVEKSIAFEIKKVGEGNDPWGGYRAGFHGTFTLNRSDFDMRFNLGRFSESMQIEFGIEGIRQ